jgi:inner membrane protein
MKVTVAYIPKRKIIGLSKIARIADMVGKRLQLQERIGSDIVEIMQKKPVHPVQYVLIGLALVIFYTLLLAFSEFIMFDLAYAIASLATILLISLYAWSHFQNWKSAGIFAGILSLLYGFIFILIRLEDTALLVGSIGLFLVLAIVMYASRKVNWYGSSSK